MADVDEWAEEARRQGYTVKGSGWHRYKVRKHEDGRDMTRAEVKQQLIAEYGDFERTTPKHRYVHFCGNKRTVKSLKKALKLPVLKYPKRSALANRKTGMQTRCETVPTLKMPETQVSPAIATRKGDVAFTTEPILVFDKVAG